MQVADAVVRFLGDFTEVEGGLGLLPGKAAPIASRVGRLFSENMSAAIMGVGGLMAGAGAALVAASEPIEKAQATLRAAVEETGHAFDDTYKGKVEDAIKIQERYGHGAADTQEALAKLTVGYKDPQKALDEMNRAEQLAAMKHISLAEAAGILVKIHAGSTKVLKDFGINIKDSTALLANQTQATKAQEAAVTAHDKAVAALSALEVRDAGVKKLSIAQQQQLAAAHKAVTDTASKLTEATKAKADAEAAAQGVTKNGEEIFNKLIDNYKGADYQADTFGGRLLSLKTRIGDFAGELGGKAGPALAAAGPALMTVGGILQFLIPLWTAKKVAVTTDTVATEANTAVTIGSRIAGLASAAATGVMTAAQWALNVAMDANPIGLVVLAIAALVGGAILAYQHIGWFRDAVNFAWKEIQVLWDWIANKLMPVVIDIAKFLFEHSPLGIALKFVLDHFKQISDAVSTAWEMFKGFGDFLGKVFTKMLHDITGPLGKVGDAINALNPFKRSSPSLVENVIAGTDIIKGRYTALSGMSLGGPSISGIRGEMPTLAGAMAGSASGGGSMVQHFNFPNYVGSKDDLEQWMRQVSARQAAEKAWRR